MTKTSVTSSRWRLERSGHNVTTTTSPSHALELVAERATSTSILTDLGMSELSGLELCERMLGIAARHARHRGHGARQHGDRDRAPCASAPTTSSPSRSTSKLLGLIGRAPCSTTASRRGKRRLQRALGEPASHSGLVGESAAMRRVYELIERVGATDASVLIQGETGTGKELVARALHNAEPAQRRPVRRHQLRGGARRRCSRASCSATRAARSPTRRRARTGLFVQATAARCSSTRSASCRSTMQPKLLRALQERKVRPVGGNHGDPVRRAHRRGDQPRPRDRGRREALPRGPLLPHQRRAASTCRRCASAAATCSRSRSTSSTSSPSAARRPRSSSRTPAAEKLLAYDWPGNVRELENCIERAVALARFDQVTVDDLPEKIRAYRAERFVVAARRCRRRSSRWTSSSAATSCACSTLVGGNKSRAAQILGFDRRTLYRKLERYEGTHPRPALDESVS